MIINAFVVRNVLTRRLLRQCPRQRIPVVTSCMPDVFYVPEEAEQMIESARCIYHGHHFEIEDIQVVIGSPD